MSFDELKDKYIGEKGTAERDAYELELKVEVIGEMIKKVSKENHLTKEELGKLVGVNKSQISKLERNTNNVTIATILKIFRALKTSMKFTLERADDPYKRNMV
jgi:transcriptional regulator with XRE-family HTH domain